MGHSMGSSRAATFYYHYRNLFSRVRIVSIDGISKCNYWNACVPPRTKQNLEAEPDYSKVLAFTPGFTRYFYALQMPGVIIIRAYHANWIPFYLKISEA